MRAVLKTFLVLILLINSAFAAESVSSVLINTPKDWGKEIIQLPPGFAKDMKYKGSEDIRFSPGMFKPESDFFFTYVFTLSGTLEGGLSLENVKSEILKYYKGLALAVGGKKFSIDPKTFELELNKTDKGFSGTLLWVEPFRTGKKQKLYIELKSWSSPKKQILFAMVSPAEKNSAVWTKLKEIEKKLSITKEQ